MAKKTFRKNKEEEPEVDFGLGKLGLGGIFKGIEKFIELAERAEKAGGKLKRSGTIKGLGKNVKGVYGFTVRTGLGKRPKFDTFGNIKETKEGPTVVETREPIVDVFDEKDEILVIAELPGIDEKTIKLDLKKDILFLKAENSKRKYEKEILLPAEVDFESREMSYKHGVLEARFKKLK